MAQGHGQRLGVRDAALLEMETSTVHMHLGGVYVFGAPPSGSFDFEQFVRLVRSRLHLLPRYRQKLAFPPLGLAHPVWVDDPDFDLGYHVRHAALPRPGTASQLHEYAARLLSRRLDRSRPLWELYVVEGLEEGGFAIVGKHHVAMVAGTGGLDLATVVLDLSDEVPTHLPDPQPWRPHALPSGLDLARDGVRDVVGEVVGESLSTVAAVAREAGSPGRLARRAFAVAKGTVTLGRSALARPSPGTLLNRPPGISRRLMTHQMSLDDVRGVSQTFDASVTDVVLALVGDVLGRYLRQRGERTTDLQLRLLVPLAAVDEGPGGSDADGLASSGAPTEAALVDVPVDELDPVVRLRECRSARQAATASHVGLGADVLLGMTRATPAPLQGVGARLAGEARLYNVLVTSVPGPRSAIHCLGAPLRGAYPFVPLTGSHTIAFGVTSHGHALSIGITADWDGIPDVDVFAEFFDVSLSELVRCADAEREHQARVKGPPPRRATPPANREAAP